MARESGEGPAAEATMQAPSARTVGAAGCDAIVKIEATAPVSTRWRQTEALSSQLQQA